MAHPVDELLAKWNAAVRKGDAAALGSLVTEDSEFWAPGKPPLSGQVAVRAAYETLFRDYRMDQVFDEAERLDFGDHVLVRGTERTVVTPRKGIGETTLQERVFTLFRRDADGQWRVARGISQFLAP